MKNQPVEYPEFAVTRQRLSSYFSPPLARSTFYDLVNRGKIQPVSGVRGYYRLNASLQRMGMPVVKELPPESPPQKEDGGYRGLALLALWALMETLGSSKPVSQAPGCRVSSLIMSPWVTAMRGECWQRFAGR